MKKSEETTKRGIILYEAFELKSNLIREEKNKADKVLEIQAKLKISEEVIDELFDNYDYKS